MAYKENADNPSFMMPLSELLARYAPVYPHGGSWQDTVNLMRSSPSEWAIVQELIRQAREQGGFREPVILEPMEDFHASVKEDTAEGRVPAPFPTVMDGTHRVCASIVDGREEILVSIGYSETDDWDEWDENRAVVTDLLLGPIQRDVKLDSDHEDVLDVVFDRARSFPISDDVWVTASTMATQGLLTCNIMWDIRPNDADDELLDKISARVRETLERAGVHVEGVHSFVEKVRT